MEVFAKLSSAYFFHYLFFLLTHNPRRPPRYVLNSKLRKFTIQGFPQANQNNIIPLIENSLIISLRCVGRASYTIFYKSHNDKGKWNFYKISYEKSSDL